MSGGRAGCGGGAPQRAAAACARGPPTRRRCNRTLSSIHSASQSQQRQGRGKLQGQGELGVRSCLLGRSHGMPLEPSHSQVGREHWSGCSWGGRCRPAVHLPAPAGSLGTGESERCPRRRLGRGGPQLLFGGHARVRPRPRCTSSSFSRQLLTASASASCCRTRRSCTLPLRRSSDPPARPLPPRQAIPLG